MEKRSHRGRAAAERGGGPRPLGDVLGDLFAERGYARLRAGRELEAAWESAAGPEVAGRTKPGGLRRGVLTVSVGHPTLLEELAAFRKPALLAALRREVPGTPIHDIRFRVGPVD